MHCSQTAVPSLWKKLSSPAVCQQQHRHSRSKKHRGKSLFICLFVSLISYIQRQFTLTSTVFTCSSNNVSLCKTGVYFHMQACRLTCCYPAYFCYLTGCLIHLFWVKNIQFINIDVNCLARSFYCPTRTWSTEKDTSLLQRVRLLKGEVTCQASLFFLALNLNCCFSFSLSSDISTYLPSA